MNGVELRGVLARPGFTLDVDLALPGQGFTALFGPSGSGKTSCLRLIAGLERVRDARVVVRGEIWQDSTRCTPAHRRAVGYVFQEANLFPHLDVRGNLEFGWRRAGRPAQVDRDGVIALLGIGALLDRPVQKLSGGEAQRVAIARALLSAPRLLLLDEPLASLDAARKAEILPWLERLHAALDIPAIYVSHAVDEIARLADHLVLLEGGRVRAAGPTTELLSRLELADAFAADPGVVLDARITAHDDHDQLTQLAFVGGALFVPRRVEPVGQSLRCRVHARDVSLTLDRPSRSSILNLVPARVLDHAPAAQPGQVLVRLDAGGAALLASITRRSLAALDLRPGTEVWAQIKGVALLA